MGGPKWENMEGTFMNATVFFGNNFDYFLWTVVLTCN